MVISPVVCAVVYVIVVVAVAVAVSAVPARGPFCKSVFRSAIAIAIAIAVAVAIAIAIARRARVGAFPGRRRVGLVVFGFFSRALWLGGRVQVHADCRVLESNSNAPRFPELCQLARAVNIAARDPCL